jgi:glycogen phosphorylase
MAIADAVQTASNTPSSAEQIRAGMLEKLLTILGKFPAIATPHDWYLALAHAVRDQLMHRWIETASTYYQQQSRTVVYLSAEFLMGPQLGCNLIALGLRDAAREAVTGMGLDLDELLQEEEEPGLGNGGLGRLAACYMDSLATLAIPAIGYGIRYEFGIFDQAINDGWQVEMTDKWLRYGNAWEVARPQVTLQVKLGGHTEPFVAEDGSYRVRWIPHRIVNGTPYDTPAAGYGVRNVNLLRLWQAVAAESFDLQAFNSGDYYGAVDQKVASENLTKVLYPNDEPVAGKVLRLEQQFFFVSCSLQDMIRLYLQRQSSLAGLPDKFAIQLNDTHPAIAVAEQMRLLVDEHALGWDDAWSITTRSFGYTNHTLLPEALETWPLDLFARVLPRHLEIIYEINRRFLQEVRERFPGDDARVQRMSLIDDAGGKRVRMANLACVGSHAINGVAALHSELLASTVLRDFHEMWPHKFSNKTNGVSPRRFMAESNPSLSALITRAIGDGWLRDLDELQRLEPLAGDSAFRAEWRAVKRGNKVWLAQALQRSTGVSVDPDSLFDVQAKRIHEYKRQHLNVLHIISLYARLLRGDAGPAAPRTFVFAGKAAPGYFLAKRFIKLINSVAAVVNADPVARGHLRVVFYPDFNVKNARPIYAGADLSEQISTAGKEASGTGNMKFALNGALTIGTLDGANVEIRDAVGAENFFLFGLTAAEVAERRGSYDPSQAIADDTDLAEVIGMLEAGRFSGGDHELFAPIVRTLRERDDYCLIPDYRPYIECQESVGNAFADPDAWTRMCIINVARLGCFSSDRAIREYCRDIWNVSPVAVG